MEQNAARGMVEGAFREKPHRPRIGLYVSEGRMKLSFITPQVGNRYSDLVRELERETGWSIEVSDSMRPNELVDAALRLLAQSGLGARRVSVVGNIVEARGPFGSVDAAMAAEIQRQYLELTGIELRFRVEPATGGAG